MTIAADNVARFATADRQARADQVLTAAVREAAGVVLAGGTWERAAVVLGKAERSASRILGRAAA